MNNLERCKLTKISAINDKPNPNALRTDAVEGFCSAFPTEGSCFQMLAKALEGGGIRWVRTSTIKKVMSTVFPNPNKTTLMISFMTENSIYELEVFFEDS